MSRSHRRRGSIGGGLKHTDQAILASEFTPKRSRLDDTKSNIQDAKHEIQNILRDVTDATVDIARIERETRGYTDFILSSDSVSDDYQHDIKREVIRRLGAQYDVITGNRLMRVSDGRPNTLQELQNTVIIRRYATLQSDAVTPCRLFGYFAGWAIVGGGAVAILVTLNA